jgi:glycosyltransferase involved in cell wall biosynthesis
VRIAIYHHLHSGGAKRTLYEQARRLARTHQLTLYSFTSADNAFCDARPFVGESRIVEFSPGRLFDRPFGRLNQAVRLRDLTRLRALNGRISDEIEASDYDVVLVHPCRYTQGPLVLHCLATPSVYYCHEPYRMFYETLPSRPYGQRASWRRVMDRLDPINKRYLQTVQKIDRVATQKASLVITNSQFTQQGIRWIYAVDAAVSYHGVDLETFRHLALPKQNIVVSVGSLTPNKGFDFIIESLGQVPASLRPELVIVSNYQEPTERDYLEQLASTYRVRLNLRTLVPIEELVHLYNIAWLVVYAPVREPFGLVPLEAMACGTPVVAVREGGVSESVVDGHTGCLVDRDPKAFARAVETLLEDDCLIKRFGQQAREYVAAEWTWDRAIRKLETYLQQAISENGRGG